jgi:methionyl-tRNA formyltransferase
MKLCIAGKNNIAIDILEYALNYFKKENIYIISNKSDNGVNKFQRSLKKYSLENGFKLVSLNELYDFEDLIFLSLEFDTIIIPSLFKSKLLFNIHFSSLPKYKGMYTSYWPIINGETHSGVTLHLIDQGIDTGDIIQKFDFSLDKYETSKSLYLKYIFYGTKLVKSNIQNLIYNRFVPLKQNTENSSYYSIKSVDYSNLTINLNNTANQISIFIRALRFRDFQLTKINNYQISHSKILNSKSNQKAGTLLNEDEFSFIYATVDYDIQLFKDKLDLILDCSKTGKLNILMNLYSLGYSFEDQNQKGWTPLIVACFNGQIDVVNFLLSIEVNPNMPNFNGTTPLMFAKDDFFISKNPAIILTLLNNGANLFIRDYRNRNLFDYLSTIQLEYFTKIFIFNK